jgi:hypothetical protein
MLQSKKTSSILLFLHTHGALDVNHFILWAEKGEILSEKRQFPSLIKQKM